MTLAVLGLLGLLGLLEFPEPLEPFFSKKINFFKENFIFSLEYPKFPH